MGRAARAAVLPPSYQTHTGPHCPPSPSLLLLTLWTQVHLHQPHTLQSSMRTRVNVSRWPPHLLALGVGLVLFALVAPAAAQPCQQLGVSVTTGPRGKRGQVAAVKAGGRVRVYAKVTNGGPADLINNLAVGVTLPAYLLPTKTSILPRPKNKALARPVTEDGRDLYWRGLSLPAGKTRR